VSTSFCVGYLSVSANHGQFCRPSASYGAVASVSITDVSTSAKSQSVATGPRSVLIQTRATLPVSVSGTLPGTMAGKRPASLLAR